MKLDYECVRDIMLTIEELECDKVLREDNLKDFSRLEKYTPQQISYTIRRMNEAGFLQEASVVKLIHGITYYVSALTWEGHQYLDCIRSDSIWNDIKRKIPPLDAPFKIIGQIAFNQILNRVTS